MIGGRLGGGPETGLPVRAEINVTSLVDVAFTLLVIFMITAPILQGGVEVAVPRAPSAPLQVAEGLMITVDRDGQIYVDDDAFTRDEFAATIVQMVERKGGPTVYVKGDRDVPYGSVLWVIGLLKEAEIDAVSLIAEPDTDR
ncbi:MAG: biopolymer transporter ExbD [Gemmatimonadetes bacterium]|nr:biopolymer transporter ExbD [Gemmatimonadota bacterium]NNK48908.1 biopolymer transporter ExbD [Gemmatimonadota bacterium]